MRFDLAELATEPGLLVGTGNHRAALMRHKLLLMFWLLALVGASPSPAQTALDGFNPNANGSVLAITQQADGKILIGGSFSNVGGHSGRVVRLHADGSVDSSFAGASLTSGTVFTLHLAADGSLLIGGKNLVASKIIVVGGLMRIDPSGSFDLGFKPVPVGEVNAISDDGANGYFIGGNFLNVAGQPREHFARLNAAGVSISGNLLGVNAPVHTLMRNSLDGKLYLGGEFTQLGGQPVNRLARLRSDDSRDPFFNASVDGTVLALAETANGEIFVGGEFAAINGSARARFARLTDRGALSSVPGAVHSINDRVRAIAVMENGDVVIAGDFTLIDSKSSHRITRFGRNSTGPMISGGSNAPIHALLHRADDSLIVGGDFTDAGGAVRNRIARVDGHEDLDLTLATSHNGSNITAIARLRDHSWLVAGDFSTFDGELRGHLTRMDNTGAVLTPIFGGSADPQLNGVPLAIAVAGDGRIIVGGEFTSAFGSGAGFLIRLNADASERESFAQFSAQINGRVRVLAVQPDGGILVGGDFTQVSGVARNGLARLLPGGGLDTAFQPNLVFGSSVRALALSRAGAIVFGGNFSSVSGFPRNNLARLDGTGSVDASFNPAPNGRVDTLLIQPNNDILIGGEFTTIAGASRVRVARLNATGSLDTTFNASLVAGNVARVQSLALQGDNRVLLGGSNGLITRRLASGVGDPTFAVTANGTVTGIALGLDGKALLTGTFSLLQGQARNGIARIVAQDRDADVAFAYVKSLSRILWGVRDSAANVIAAPVLSVSLDGGNSFVDFGPMTPFTSSLWRMTFDISMTGPLLFKIQAAVAGGSAGASVSMIQTRHALQLDEALFADGFD